MSDLERRFASGGYMNEMNPKLRASRAGKRAQIDRVKRLATGKWRDDGECMKWCEVGGDCQYDESLCCHPESEGANHAE